MAVLILLKNRFEYIVAVRKLLNLVGKTLYLSPLSFGAKLGFLSLFLNVFFFSDNWWVVVSQLYFATVYQLIKCFFIFLE